MRLTAAEAITVTLLFLPRLLAPMRRSKLSALVAAEVRAAGVEMLDRAKLRQERAAVVLSLWPERAAQQCVVAPLYAMAPGTADFSRTLQLSAAPLHAEPPEGARALWERLKSAGISAATPSEAIPVAPQSEGPRRAA